MRLWITPSSKFMWQGQTKSEQIDRGLYSTFHVSREFKETMECVFDFVPPINYNQISTQKLPLSSTQMLLYKANINHTNEAMSSRGRSRGKCNMFNYTIVVERKEDSHWVGRSPRKLCHIASSYGKFIFKVQNTDSTNSASSDRGKSTRVLVVVFDDCGYRDSLRSMPHRRDIIDIISAEVKSEGDISRMSLLMSPKFPFSRYDGDKRRKHSNTRSKHTEKEKLEKVSVTVPTARMLTSEKSVLTHCKRIVWSKEEVCTEHVRETYCHTRWF